MHFWMNFLGPNYLCVIPLQTPLKHIFCISSISGVMNVFNKHSGSMALMKVMEEGSGECCCNQRLMSLRG